MYAAAGGRSRAALPSAPCSQVQRLLSAARAPLVAARLDALLDALGRLSEAGAGAAAAEAAAAAADAALPVALVARLVPLLELHLASAR